MEKGTYALIIALKSEATIAVGKLGGRGREGGENEITFPSGYYVYFGSALGGLSGRVSRYLRSEGDRSGGKSEKRKRGGGGEGSAKKLHWHIDYLIQFAKVVEVWYAVEGEEREWRERKRSLECIWCRVARGMLNGQILFPGFGSSDCRCPAHLIYFSSPPSFEFFRQMLEERGYRAKKPLRFLSGTA